MSITLYLSPNIHSTQEHLLGRIASLKKEQPLLPIHLLLPTTQAARSLRSLVPQALGLHFLQFYSLAESILEEAALPVTRIREAGVREVVQSILKRLHQNGTLTTFDAVWDKPGFTQVIIEWLREMKTQGIHPIKYWEHAQVSGGLREMQLAIIYRDYQSHLQERQLSDADGLLWLAMEALEDDPLLGHSTRYLFISGFDHFNPIQLRLLRTLIMRYAQAAFYLLWDNNRKSDSLTLARMLDVRYAIEKDLNAQVQVLEDTSDVHPGVRHLRQTLFESSQPLYTSNEPLPIHAIEAPSRELEVRWALREIKRLLLGGVSPLDITLLAPNPQVYLPILQSISHEYGLPLQTQQSLAEVPVIIALTNILRLAPEFPWRATLDALRSPYIDQPWLSMAQIDLLDQLSRERPVIAGREQWQFALQPIDLLVDDPEDEELSPPQLASQIPPGELRELEAGLMDFFNHITPPESATYLDYALWVQEALLGLYPGIEDAQDAPSLNILARCQDPGDFTRRDLNALAVLLDVMRDMIAVAQLVTPDDQPLTWESFRAALFRDLSIPVLTDPNLAEIRLALLEAGRDAASDYLFILGMSEGEFPTPPPPDALFSPGEREQHPLPLLRYRPALDASLWWQVLCTFSRKLYLLRPRLDDNGATWLPSPYWDEILEKVPNVDVENIPIGYLANIEHACSPGELLLALVARHAQAAPPELEPQWLAAQYAGAIMQQRRSWNPPGAFEGYIQSPALQAELSQRYSPSYGWSVSKLNSYGNCPYGFFVQLVLGLEARPEPEEGLNAMQRGTLLHAMLELLFQRIASRGLNLIIENLTAIQEILEDVCLDIFPRAPQRYGFRPSALWRHEQLELQRLVAALVSWECHGNGNTARFHPYLQEVRFGIPGSRLPNLHLDRHAGEPFNIHGVIDRVDRDEEGNLRVIDYKSGSSTISKNDIRRGYALQTALYSMAAERLITDAGQVVRSYYLHIPTRVTSGDLNFEDSGEAKEVVMEALEVSACFIDQIRRGIYLSAPTKPTVGAYTCRDRCDFAVLCRVTRQSIGKARRTTS
jgi:ATP-dependent helicase/nuclease subunit B